MTKGMEGEGGYHKRTELGIGQHDEIKRKLDEERHQEYRDHVMRKDADKKRLDDERHQDYQDYQEHMRSEEEREQKYPGSGEPAETDVDQPETSGTDEVEDVDQPEASVTDEVEDIEHPVTSGTDGIQEQRGRGVCDIGYETGRNIAEMRKHLNEERRAEYVAHLAARAAAGPVDHHETYNMSSQISVGHQLAESTRNSDAETFNLSETDGVPAIDERRQKQLDYAEALRLQIEEKKRLTAGDKKREDEEDRKNMEMMQASSVTFNYGSYRPSEYDRQ